MSSVYASDNLHNGYPPATTASYTNGATANQPQAMDGMKQEYTQPGLTSPSTSSERGHDSEDASTDHPTAPPYSQPGQEAKYPATTSTPASEYGRSGNYPDYMHRTQYPDSTHRHYAPGGQNNSSAGNIPQSTSPSMPAVDGLSHGHPDGVYSRSDMDVPIDPSIAAASPTYPHHQHYTTYPQQQAQHDIPHYQQSPGMYQRSEYGSPYSAGHAQGMPNNYAHAQSPVNASPSVGPGGTRPPGGGHPLSTVYSFVPIPGTHQQKRPRRRYEEIERMYKCGWNGCDKAYGTLNHLNAHVTMQSHGQKRTPEEFKEIRKEWKARKKDEENMRKQDDDGRSRPSLSNHPSQDGGHSSSDSTTPHTQAAYQQGGRPILPPLGYAPAGGPPAQYGQPGPGMEGMTQYSQTYYPQSPYGQS